MPRVTLSLLTAFSLLTFSAVTATAETDLGYAPTFSDGETIDTEVEVEIDQTLNIAGMEVVTAVNNFVATKDTVTDATPGQVKVAGEVAKMQIDLSLPGGIKLNYDSGSPNNPAPAGPLGEIMKYMEIAGKAKWEMEFGSDGKVKSAQYLGDLINNLPEMYKSDLSNEQLAKETNMAINRLPTESVSKGDSWERNEEAPLGNGQVFHIVKGIHIPRQRIAQRQTNGEDQIRNQVAHIRT